jgi:hypothetical protein
MARSGVVQVRSANREKRYWLQPGVLDPLLRPEGEPTPWRNWSPLFRSLEILWLGLIEPRRQVLDRLLLSSELRRLAWEMKPLLGEAGWGQHLRDDRAFTGEAYADVFFQDVKGILERLNRQQQGTQ